MRMLQAQAVSKFLGKVSLPNSWWKGCSEPQTTFPSSPVILQTRVIHRPHVWWLWQAKLKFSYGFSSSQNDPSPKLTQTDNLSMQNHSLGEGMSAFQMTC